MARKKIVMARPIQTVFYQRHDVIKTTRSKWANSACKHAFGHMQLEHYDATHCEVHDLETGELHAVFKRRLVKGEIVLETLFKREVKEGM